MPTSVRIRRERMNEAKRIAAGMRWQKLGTTAFKNCTQSFFFFFLPSYFLFLLVFFRRNWKRSKRDYYSDFLSSNRGEMKKRIITKNNDVRLRSFFFFLFFSPQFFPFLFFSAVIQVKNSLNSGRSFGINFVFLFIVNIISSLE